MIKPPDITSGERTELVYGIENVAKFSACGLSKVEKNVDVCWDYFMPPVILASERSAVVQYIGIAFDTSIWTVLT